MNEPESDETLCFIYGHLTPVKKGQTRNPVIISKLHVPPHDSLEMCWNHLLELAGHDNKSPYHKFYAKYIGKKAIDRYPQDRLYPNMQNMNTLIAAAKVLVRENEVDGMFPCSAAVVLQEMRAKKLKHSICVGDAPGENTMRQTTLKHAKHLFSAREGLDSKTACFVADHAHTYFEDSDRMDLGIIFQQEVLGTVVFSTLGGFGFRHINVDFEHKSNVGAFSIDLTSNLMKLVAKNAASVFGANGGVGEMARVVGHPGLLYSTPHDFNATNDGLTYFLEHGLGFDPPMIAAHAQDIKRFNERIFSMVLACAGLDHKKCLADYDFVTMFGYLISSRPPAGPQREEWFAQVYHIDFDAQFLIDLWVKHNIFVCTLILPLSRQGVWLRVTDLSLIHH